MPNSGVKTAAAKVLAGLLNKFPDAPALTLAKTAYRDHPELWPNLEACRSAIRLRLGIHGDENRKKVKTEWVRPPRQSGDWSAYLPEALSHFSEWGPVEVSGPFAGLVLSDIHIPYHDLSALSAAIQYGIDNKANLILLNGDVMDFYNVSRYEKDPRQRDFPAEVRAGKEFIGGLRKVFPKARIIWKEGNHEERFEKYLRLKAPELLGIPDFSWQSVLGLDEHKVEFVGEKRPIRFGKGLNVIHGHEYRFNISNPVNPARGFFLRAKTHTLGGHFHQTSSHSEKNLDQHVVTCWSTGCLANLNPAYSPINNHNHGFAFVSCDKSGAFDVDNLRIFKGKVYR